MSTTGDINTVSSVGYVIRTPSETPSANPSNQSSKKPKSSKSSLSIMKRSSTDTTLHKFEIPKDCECGPDLYSRVLGPTADETILTGLRTIIDLCGKLRTCGNDNMEADRTQLQELPERDVSGTTKELRMVSAGFQVTPSVKSVAVETASLPEVVSEILETVGVTPEMISKLIQTSFAEPKKPSLVTILMQTSNPSLISGAVQTTLPDLTPGTAQTTPYPIKIPTDSVKTQSDLMLPEPPADLAKAYDTQQTLSGDEHKAISPPEPPETLKTCRCCKCSSSSNLKRDSKDSKSSDEKSSKCKCDDSGKKRSSMFSEPDPKAPTEVKYAVAIISKYNEFMTFEIMKSTKNQPRHMPKTIESVFVLKKKNGKAYGTVYEGSKSDTNGMKRRTSRNGKNGVLKEPRGDVNGRS